MRVFLDIGSHEGQTIEEAIKPTHGFDVVHGFEPMPHQFAVLVERFGSDRLVRLHQLALGASDGTVEIYGDNAQMEASIWRTKRDVDPTKVTTCQMRSVSRWIAANTCPTDQLTVKLNCEGAEIPILDDLCDSGMFDTITAMLIDFDSRKVDGLEGEDGRIVCRLHDAGFDRFITEWPAGVSHQDRIAAWLAAA